jgi:NAD(P)-dependent dehydrogenase (short-subunit alcohol dehydrogenase family)
VAPLIGRKLTWYGLGYNVHFSDDCLLDINSASQLRSIVRRGSGHMFFAMNKHIHVDMSGKIAIVTGPTTGIGKEIARGLARMGATVILGARDEARGQAAREDIMKDTGNAKIEVMRIDVSEPASVRAFAERFSKRHTRLDVLVNNAGVWFTDRRESTAGRELTFATNVVGPWLLTTLLEDRLRAAAPSRVVNVVSSLASNYDASDLEWTRRKYDGFKVYAQSKAAERMVTWGLAERFGESRITVNAAAPGFVKTEFNRAASGFIAGAIDVMAKLFGATPAAGADTPLWAAVAPELANVTGKYFDARQEKERKFDAPEAIADLESRLAVMAA